MKKDKLDKANEMQRNINRLNKVKDIVSSPHLRLLLRGYHKPKIIIGDGGYDEEYYYLSELDKETRAELKNAVNDILNKRIKELEKELEEL